MTYCRARFRDFVGVFRLHWRGEELAAGGGATYPQPVFVELVPDGHDRFQTFHLGLPSAASVRFIREGGTPVLARFMCSYGMEEAAGRFWPG